MNMNMNKTSSVKLIVIVSVLVTAVINTKNTIINIMILLLLANIIRVVAAVLVVVFLQAPMSPSVSGCRSHGFNSQPNLGALRIRIGFGGLLIIYSIIRVGGVLIN